MSEGQIDVTGGRVWYRTYGEGDATAVLLLHGGPGAASDYMQPLAERLGEHRPAIVYDQLGCGRSEHPDDDSLWTVDRSVAEVDQVREALGQRLHVVAGRARAAVEQEHRRRVALAVGAVPDAAAGDVDLPLAHADIISW